MEASTLQAPAGLARHRIAIGVPLLRLRSDEQLVALFRAGHDEAFRAIHDRYEKRLLAYTRQMLPRGQDAEDALQDVFVRAYSGLRASQRELALRAWLFRVAHNRCIDELRRPAPPPPEVLQLTNRRVHDPVAEAEGRESLRRLIADVRRLPEQQRSALLMREMGGMSYAELADALGTSVAAVKSLLVRARLGLTEAAAARDTACSQIREELAEAHGRGVRPNATAKRHMRDCPGCRSFRRELRTVNRRLAALAPLGPFALLANVLGVSGGAGASSGATAGGAGGATGGAAALSGAASGGGALASSAVVVGSGHVATLLAAAVATAGSAVAITSPPAQPSHARPAAKVRSTATGGMRTAAAGVAYQPENVQEAAASGIGTSLTAQTAAKSTLPAAGARPRQRPARAMAPSSPTDSTTMPPVSADPSTSTGPPVVDPTSSVGVTLNGGSEPSSSGTTSTGSGSGTGSTGSGSAAGAGSTGSPTGTDTPSSGSSSTGSTGSTGTSGSGSGTSTGTAGSGSGTGSSGTTSTGTSPDSSSGTTTGSSGSGTSTPSK